MHLHKNWLNKASKTEGIDLRQKRQPCVYEINKGNCDEYIKEKICLKCVEHARCNISLFKAVVVS